MLDSSHPAPAADRPPLTMAQFVMLRSLCREGTWAEGDAPLWKVSRHWSHSREHFVEALTACWDLEHLGLVVSSRRTCCEVHRGAQEFTLSERGKAMLVRINGRRRAPLPVQWIHTHEILALARACVAVTVVEPTTAVQLVLAQAQYENALRLGSYQERFVKLVKSARKVAAGRSVRDLAELDGVLRSSTSVPLEFADSIYSVLSHQPKRVAVADQLREPTEQEKH